MTKDSPQLMKEAFVQQSGQRLGKVGSRIIAEVFFGLLQSDATSYVHEPGWVPVLSGRDGSVGNFTMVDLLTFAGVA